MANDVLEKLTEDQRDFFDELLIERGLQRDPTSAALTIQINRNGRQVAYFDGSSKSKGGLIGYRFLFPEDAEGNEKYLTKDNNGLRIGGESEIINENIRSREEERLLRWACKKFACSEKDIRVRPGTNKNNKNRLFLDIMSKSVAFRALEVEVKGMENVSPADGGPQIEVGSSVAQVSSGVIAKLSQKQLRILKILALDGGWFARRDMEEQAGEKGYSKALGAPTRGEPRSGALEQLRYVERRDLKPPFEYRITEAGKRALAKYERKHGEVQLLSLAKSTQADDIVAIVRQEPGGTTTTALINARLGQGRFRTDVMQYWGNACAITGSTVTDAIRASHIKPWRDADETTERLDPLNGLPLVASLDALFDKGLITFDDGGKLLISKQLKKSEQEIFGLAGKSLRKDPPEKTLTYLKYHRDNIFRR